jgi:hypothetical protein
VARQPHQQQPAASVSQTPPIYCAACPWSRRAHANIHHSTAASTLCTTPGHAALACPFLHTFHGMHGSTTQHTLLALHSTHASTPATSQGAPQSGHGVPPISSTHCVGVLGVQGVACCQVAWVVLRPTWHHRSNSKMHGMA